jgi:hypothetical protein
MMAARVPVGASPGRFCARVAFACALLLGACSSDAPPSAVAETAGGWHDFEGTWTATGTRSTLHLAGVRTASVATFEGSLMLSGAARPNVGFRAQAVVLTDSATGVTGRAVWTDERGDQVYSELRGEGTAAANRIVGTFQDGTGRYRGATGSYEFSWRFLVAAEDGVVQGQSQGLHGRVRIDPRAAGGPP